MYRKKREAETAPLRVAWDAASLYLPLCDLRLHCLFCDEFWLSRRFNGCLLFVSWQSGRSHIKLLGIDGNFGRLPCLPCLACFGSDLFGVFHAGLKFAPSLDGGVRYLGGEQAHSTNGIIVGRNRIIHLIGIAVCIGEGNDGDFQATRLQNGGALFARIDDKEGGGQPLHVFDAAQQTLQACDIVLKALHLFLGQPLEFATVAAGLKLAQVTNTRLDRLEVSQHAAQPALVDVVHAATFRLFGYGLLGLLLRTNEENALTVGSELLDEIVGFIEARDRLLKIDDMNAVAVHEDEGCHLRIPASGLMPKVDTGLKKLFH